MSITLVKEKAEKVGISLEKKGIVKVPPLRVVADYDVSGSMQGEYRSGHVQSAADQVLGVAYKFDDDGEVDVFVFDHEASRIGTSNAEDFGTYVSKNITSGGNHHLWGSTSYQAALRANMDFLFPTEKKGGFLGFGGKTVQKDPNPKPALVLFFTDGEPDSNDDAASIIEDALEYPVYFQLVGVGNATFSKLKRLADTYDNCGFVNISSSKATDEEMYNELMSDEFVSWLKKIGAS